MYIILVRDKNNRVPKQVTQGMSQVKEHSFHNNRICFVGHLVSAIRLERKTLGKLSFSLMMFRFFFFSFNVDRSPSHDDDGFSFLFFILHIIVVLRIIFLAFSGSVVSAIDLFAQ